MATTCPKCQGDGWVWWTELDDYDGPANETGEDDTQYLCPECHGDHLMDDPIVYGRCPKCGGCNFMGHECVPDEVPEDDTAYAKMWRCLKCGAMNTPTTIRCWSCRTDQGGTPNGSR